MMLMTMRQTDRQTDRQSDRPTTAKQYPPLFSVQACIAGFLMTGSFFSDLGPFKGLKIGVPMQWLCRETSIFKIIGLNLVAILI